MAAPFQIVPATPDETAKILGLEQLCQSVPWDEPIIRTFLVAAGHWGIDTHDCRVYALRLDPQTADLK